MGFFKAIFERIASSPGLLKCATHFYAATRFPRRYALASWWRIRGKRLRARAQFAPLLGTSPLAYRYWVQREQRGIARARVNGDASIFALVAIPAENESLQDTLGSLQAESLAFICIDETSGGAPSDLLRACLHGGGEQWFLPIRAGDVLAPGAAHAYRAAIARAAHSNPVLCYADDDLLNETGKRNNPHFKPGWNAELFQHFDYLTWSCVVRADIEDVARLAAPNWAPHLTLDALKRSEGAEAVVHVPHVLHHRHSRDAARIPSVAEIAPSLESDDFPLVSVIVPTRNRVELLRTCLNGLESTDYPSLEVIVADNDSDDPATLAYLAALDPQRFQVLRTPGAFNFSAINNQAARSATGEFLCLLNNDIEMIRPDWLKILVRQAQRREVGAVGAQLLYPDGRIQHAGVVLGIGGGAAHAHRLLRPTDEGYFSRHALPQFVSAVTAACMVIRRSYFDAVGGLDEQRFVVAFNDVDLCMRLNRRGWQSLYEPRAVLIHHESVSRGLDRDPVGAARLAGELAELKRLWGTSEGVDPFHHPQLSPFSEHFVLKL